MSLAGNLEDLPLLDILQMVSFSKKTGYLAIQAESGQAAIVFRDGLVVSAFTWDTPPLDLRADALSRESRGVLIRGRIEMALAQLIRLREGPFEFVLADEAPPVMGARDLAREALERGLNVQELLLELTRGMDEDRRDSSAALEASFAQVADAPSMPAEAPAPYRDVPAFLKGAGMEPPPMPPARPAEPLPEASPAIDPTVAPTPAALPRTLLLVDDEDDVRRALAPRLTEGGYRVVEAADPETAVKKARELGRERTPFLVVSDLGMPTTGGASFQGGFEVIKRLGKLRLHPPVLLMTESLNAATQTRARQLGVTAIVFKPGLSKLEPMQFEADLRAFARELVDDVLPRVAAAAAASPPAPESGKAPLAPPTPPLPPEPLSPPRVASTPAEEDLARQVGIVQRALEELRQRGEPGRISNVLMNAARGFYERGILFLVKNEALRGLGGYGPAAGEEGLGLLAREVVIPLTEPSLFRDTVRQRRVFSGPLPDDPWSRHLMDRIGRFRSREVALLPLVAQRETIAILFLDNPSTGDGAARLDILELFVNQAGIALENAFLQRKLQSLQRP